jgi:hypothetical protein
MRVKALTSLSHERANTKSKQAGRQTKKGCMAASAQASKASKQASKVKLQNTTKRGAGRQTKTGAAGCRAASAQARKQASKQASKRSEVTTKKKREQAGRQTKPGLQAAGLQASN